MVGAFINALDKQGVEKKVYVRIYATQTYLKGPNSVDYYWKFCTDDKGRHWRFKEYNRSTAGNGNNGL